MKIRDNKTGEIFEYGSNRHHALRISRKGGCLIFENLQNGDGSLESGGGGYSFVLDDGKTPEESDSPDAINYATYANIGGFYIGDTKNEEDILKFYYCESEDDYYIGKRIQNMYYAKYGPGGFTWFMSRYLPWGTDGYPSEPKEIPFMEWIEGFIRKHMNDGWIPVEERLPEEKVSPVYRDFYEYQVTVNFGFGEEVRTYKYGNGHWWHGPGIVDQYVIAWKEKPEPYRPERSNKE